MSETNLQNEAASQDVMPTEVGMIIQTGMLESLGINMYNSIGKSLVEFVANSFDAEANRVDIIIPFEKIAKALSDVRELAIKEGKRQVYDSLPEDLEIVINDDGHGMTVYDLENKFLKINRNRREETGSDKSENGKRSVMGRKGLGKLAGFGVAGKVLVRTKRAGETYATNICMDYDDIATKDDIADVKFPTNYEYDLDVDEQGTKITLQKLRCDSFKQGENSIEATLARNFYITGDDFTTYLNDDEVKDPDVDYEFIYPPEDLRDEEGLAEATVEVHEGFDYPIKYAVKFRARGNSSDGKVRGHLPAAYRGARVYCNQRLAAGPTLFNLETGMHNFHAQSYMECVVDADVLDQDETDLIGTNRSGLKTDNEIVGAFIDTVTELMRKAIYAHSKFRDAVVEKEMEEDPVTSAILTSVSVLPLKTREPARKILTTLAAREGIDSPIYQEVAPHLVRAINSSEVLGELIKSGINPEDFKSIIGQLTELANVERSDVLKLYRARRHAIDGLQKLQDRSHTDKKRYEDELQELLKNEPWLIRPEYSKYLTSDDRMATVAKELTEILQIDTSAKNVDDSKDKRPDLVFVAVDPACPSHVSVVELKSPNVPLGASHLTQLEGYIGEVEAYLEGVMPELGAKVTGHLIGNMPKPDTSAIDCKTLISKMKKAGSSEQWEVITIPAMLNRAKQIHQDTIEALEAEEAEELGLEDVSQERKTAD
jgi:hypothetical protein